LIFLCMLTDFRGQALTAVYCEGDGQHIVLPLRSTPFSLLKYEESSPPPILR
jgi:hypothetical protein